MVGDTEETKARASLRPVLYIGLGGFGCDVLRELKKSIRELGDDYLDGTAFIGMDTHPESKTDELTTNEYIPLSLGVVPEDVARANRNFLGWYLEVAPCLKAKPIGAGADQIKAIGRLAFRFPTTLTKFTTQLDADWEQLKRFRERYSDSLAPKVYVISTVAGGTGAGCLADVLLVVGHFLRSRRSLGRYQAILVTGDAYKGELPEAQMTWLLSNTYSTFKELHHFYHATGKSEAYDEKDYKSVALDIQNLPEPSFLLGGENESGAVVASKIEDLRSMVVAYLRMDLQHAPSRGSEWSAFDFENARTFRDRPSPGWPRRTFASFGLVRAGLPIEPVSGYFALRLIRAALEAEMARAGDGKAPGRKDILARRIELVESRLVSCSGTLNRLAAGGPTDDSGGYVSLIGSSQALQLFHQLTAADLGEVLARINTGWQRDGRIGSPEPNPAAWLEAVLPGILVNEVERRLRGCDFLDIVDRFYADGHSQEALFRGLAGRFEPLFPLDHNWDVERWDDGLVVAVHSDLMERFRRLSERYLRTNSGVAWLRYDSLYDVVICRLKGAYALCQHGGLDRYRNRYEALAARYDAALRERQTALPVDAWPDARQWEGPELLLSGGGRSAVTD